MGRPRKEPDLEKHVQASVAGVDHYDERGWYRTLIYSGCDTPARAKEIKAGLFRAAMRLGVSMHAETRENPPGWDVEFTAINKSHGRAYILETHGRDRTAWPYSPRSGDPNGRRNSQG